MKFFRSFGVLFGLVLLMASCSTGPATKDDGEALYRTAEESFRDENYLIAQDQFRSFKNRFPYSSKAVDAELRIADCYFEQEQYIEAESAYEIFKELHPSHSKIDYVQYRIGMSFYHQIPDNIARDLSAAHRAIAAYNTLFERYPTSKYVKPAKKFQNEARMKLAEHERYVADFYFHRKHYLSSSYRYAALIRDFPNLGYDEEALYRLGQCYYHIRMFSNARDALNRLVQKFPNGKFASDARGLLNELKENN